MRVLSLCIGVNRQQDDDLSVLPFAGDDASELAAAFADWGEQLAGDDYEESDSILLTGPAATRANILKALADAGDRTQLSEYDLAVVHFAGHGDPAGFVLGYDAVDGEPSTGVSLEEIAAGMAAFRVRHSVLAFDACFSGRAGLLESRRTASACADAAGITMQLQSLANERRAVLWACGANERAYESGRLGHGLLSYGLLHALEHPERIERGTELSLTAWIEQALRTTANEAATEGRAQTPGRHVLWQGVTTLPRPILGRRRAAQLAQRNVFSVTPDVQSLAVYGFDVEVLSALQQRLCNHPLTPMQCRAIAPGGVLAGQSIVVSAPTSTGKSLIGELAALGAWLRGRRSVILMPSRALVQEKYEDFFNAFGPTGVTTVRSYGGVDDDDAALAALHFDVAFMTYEKCLAYCLLRPDLLDALGTVVLDEVHLLGDKERGRSVELLLGLLRARRKKGQRVQIVALSAALGDLGGLPEWLDAVLVTPDPRPVPLRVGVVDPSGRFRFRLEGAGTITHGTTQLFDGNVIRPVPGARDRDQAIRERVATEVVRSCLAHDDRRVLAFRAHKPEARSLARTLSSDCALDSCNGSLRQLTLIGSARDDSRASLQLKECLEHGVAFHVADLEPRERGIVERAVRAGEVRVTVATSTLAMGVNTPATDVILVDWKRFDVEENGQVPLGIGEIRNMVGRAGRWIDGTDEGRAYIAAASQAEADQIFQDLIEGEPEALRSRLGRMAPEDLVLALIGSGRASSVEEVIDAALDTFDGHQQGSDAQWRQNLRRGIRAAVSSLKSSGFLQQEEETGGVDRLTLSPTGAVCARELLLARSAMDVLAAANRIITSGEPLDEIALIVLAQETLELDSVATNLSWRDPGRWSGPLRKLLPTRGATLETLGHADGKTHTRRLKRLYALLRWTGGLPVSKIEEEFGAHFEDPSMTFSGTIRGIGERTTHVLRGIAALLAARYPERAASLEAMIVALRPRLELGIAAAGAELARARLGLTRPEIQALAGLGYTSAESLASALAEDAERMAQLFGSSRAAEIRARLDGAGLERLRRRRRREDDVQKDLFASLVPIETL